MNTFSLLQVEEDKDEITITNDNQYRNKKKLLQKKIDKYENNSSPELLKSVNILKCEIREYENRNVVYKKNPKKKKSLDKNTGDLKLLNQLSKQNRKLKFKQKVREQQQEKLWRKSNGPPKWTPRVHRLFPLHDRRCMKLLLLAKNNEECIFSILPDEIIDNILSNVRWDWFYVEKKKRVKRKRIKNKLLNQ